MEQKKGNGGLVVGKVIKPEINEQYYNSLVDILNKRIDISEEAKKTYLEHYSTCSDVKTHKIKVLKTILELLDMSYNSFLKVVNQQKETKLRQEANSTGSLLIDNYQKNVEVFYYNQPFFYDKSGLFWFWNDNKYELVDDVDVMNKLDDELGFMGQTVNSKLKSQYLEAFKRVGRKKLPEDAPVKWIQFKDKAFSIKSNKIYDIKPNYFFTNPIPWELGESDDTPVMDKLITEWVGEKYLKTAYEIIAYCCLREYPIHLLFCLVGCGRNGKSKFLGLINKFIGSENICSTELDTLLNSRFESFKLYKKLVCSMGETNFGILERTSLLKKLCGQDLIGFEFKNKKPFDDYNYAKIIISSNSLPTSTDTSEGFYRRWLILEFNNIFPEGHDILKDIPEQEYNNLTLKISKILHGLLKKGEFSEQGTIQERKDRYIMSSNPLPFYIKHFCTKDDSGYIQYNEFYQEYINYLRKNKKRKVSRKEFKAALEDEGFYVERADKKINYEFKTGYWVEGLKFSYNSDNSTTIPTQIPMRNGCIGKVVELSELSEKSTKIHQKCHICGKSPCSSYNEQGKPICGNCQGSLAVQEEVIK